MPKIGRRRFPAEVAPFADVGNTADLAELAALVPAGDFVVMLTGEPVEAPPGLAIVDASAAAIRWCSSPCAPRREISTSRRSRLPTLRPCRSS